MGVVSYFLGIHADRWHFDSSNEVGIVVAQVVRDCFKLVLGVGACILNNFVVNWLRGCNSCLVRNHEEVK